MYNFILIAFIGFASAQHSGEKGNCQQERDGANGMIPGRYVPQCSANGDYQPVQNHASTGHYWCVDVKTGKEVQGTRQRFVKPDCDGRPSKCDTERAAALGLNKVGHFIPKCASNGDYEHRQTHGSTGHSWCVNPKTGEEIPGTRTRRPSKPFYCGPSKCERERAAATNGRPRPGQFIPSCELNGDYKAVQNHASTGHYFCVDAKTGKEVEGTRQRSIPDCEGRPSKCDKERAVAMASNRIGKFVPKCASNGEYELVQSSGSTGHAWCVDPMTGIEVAGTRQRGATPDCEF